jgi:hypothetical protein
MYHAEFLREWKVRVQSESRINISCSLADISIMEYYPLQMSLFLVACLFTIFIDEIAVRKREEKRRKGQDRQIPELPDPDSSERRN